MPGPEDFAREAMAHGGFTTPSIEAYRMLSDAMRTLKRGDDWSAEMAERVRATVAWLDMHPEAPQDGDRDCKRLYYDYPGWRAVVDRELAQRPTGPICGICEAPIVLIGNTWEHAGEMTSADAHRAVPVRIVP